MNACASLSVVADCCGAEIEHDRIEVLVDDKKAQAPSTSAEHEHEPEAAAAGADARRDRIRLRARSMSTLEADNDIVRGITVDTLLGPTTFKVLHNTDPERLTRRRGSGILARTSHSLTAPSSWGEQGDEMRKSGLQDFELSKSAAATLFATSRPVDTLSFFISHSWRAPGAGKRTALAFYFNGRRAALGATLCAVLFATLARFRVLPSGGGFRDEGFDTRLRLGVPWGLIGGVLVFELVLARAHALSTCGADDERTAFVDKMCVMQDGDVKDRAGESLKAKAIRSFAGLVRRSERLVILLDPTYFDRLWCVRRRGALSLRSRRSSALSLLRAGACLRRHRSCTSTGARRTASSPLCYRSRSSRWSRQRNCTSSRTARSSLRCSRQAAGTRSSESVARRSARRSCSCSPRRRASCCSRASRDATSRTRAASRSGCACSVRPTRRSGIRAVRARDRTRASLCASMASF